MTPEFERQIRVWLANTRSGERACRELLAALDAERSRPLVERLREDPGAAVRAMEEAKVAGPWAKPHGYWRRDALDGHGMAATVTLPPDVAPRWFWQTYRGPMARGLAESPEAAMEAADAALVAEKWSLAGGVPEGVPNV